MSLTRTATETPPPETLTVPAEWFATVETETASILTGLRASRPGQADAVAELLAADGGAGSPFRLLAMAVLGALTGEPRPAAVVCAISRLWWAAAEALDDLADAPTPEGPGASTARTTLAALACGSVLPHWVVDRQPVAPDVRLDWERDLLRGALDALDGQLADLAAPVDAPPTWRPVMACYRGKSGAAYGRDAVMAARLATDRPDLLHSCRVFGELFGVLRQVANDAAPDSEDLANGTHTLLLAHAFDTAGAGHRLRLTRLRAEARHDPDARARLRAALHDPQVAAGYGRRVESLRRHCCGLLDRIAPPGPYRDVLHALVHTSARAAVARPDGGAPWTG
ncbi:polyprenyl synthase [Kitasatospora sp. NPDC059673]|uniref:polyprenyl synthase n=1 Tax=Kitasatospora sp. NPDC059673 TaxID=3346901 RepID=UPI0036D142BA